MKQKYLVQAKSGRRVGAIGSFGPVAVMVWAEDEYDAHLVQAYKYIEHLQDVTVELEVESHLNVPTDFQDMT